MSPVTPNPAPEFSTFAMTKSSDSRSMSAGTGRPPDPRRGVLDVRDDEVERLALDECGHGAPRDLAPGLPEDVADEQDAHARRERGCGFPCRVGRRSGAS